MDNMYESQTTDNSAGAKRKRLTQACDVCRRKKIKCDGAKPACANCVRMKQECSYLPSNKKRGPRQGYIELLEKRLDKMEKMLQNNPGDTSPEDISPTDFDAPLFQPTKSHRQFSTDSEDQAKPLVNGRTHGSLDQSPVPSPTSPSSRLSQFSPIMSHSSNSLTSRSNNAEDGGLPSSDVIEHLVAVYFEHLYPMMPILHPKFFMERIRNKKCPEVLLLSVMALSARFSTRSDILENPPWLSGEKYASRARKIINNIFDYPSLSSAQALLLLGIYEYGCSRGPRSWMLLGMALRMCTELGMHKESLHESDFSAPLTEDEWVDKESRRRLFWQIYIIDILACANSGRPRSIGEQDCQLLLPSDDGCWSNSLLYTETLDGSCSVRFKQTDDGNIIGSLYNNGKLPVAVQNDQRSRSTLSLIAYLARAATTLSRITCYINRSKIRDLNILSDKNSELMQLDEELTSLQANLPEFFQFTDENIEDFRHGTPAEFHSLVMLHGLLNTGMLLLHRPSLLLSGAAESAIVQPWIRQQIDHAKLKCNQSTDRITHILNLCVSGDPKIMVPLLSYSAYITCTVLVNVAFQDDQVEAEKARKALAICFRYLLTIRPFWSMADRFYFMARDLYGLRSKINGKGKIKFGTCPMVTSQDEMMRTASNDKSATGNPDGKKAFSLPVQTDSGFVALWQMATLQQQAQDHSKRKEPSVGPQEDITTNDISPIQPPMQSNDIRGGNTNNSYANTMMPSNGMTTQHTATMANNMAAPMKFLDDSLDDQVSVAAVTEYYSNRMASNPSTFADTGLNIPGNDPTGFNFLFDGSLLNDMMFPVMWPGMEDNVMADIRLNTPNWTLDNSNLLSMPDERPFNVQQAAPVQNTFDKILTAATRETHNGSHSLNTPP
ncbi:fungal-specific transcription factor domain-containing protein [Umbelopsis sp. AD052]|nr:fungal-specific transcription factor domain-containing protein [Umbelopsis sp. AD052]